jgi:lactoylglutathione lyase
LARFRSAWLKDIEASRTFYEKFGFKVFAGDASQNWLILKNGDHAIGLFQGMFEKNILTFNAGWDSNAQKLASFTDVRDLQRQLKAQGVQLQQQADESTTGPASFVAVDPDGNPILVDQHVWAGWLRPRDWTWPVTSGGGNRHRTSRCT